MCSSFIATYQGTFLIWFSLKLLGLVSNECFFSVKEDWVYCYEFLKLGKCWWMVGGFDAFDLWNVFVSLLIFSDSRDNEFFYCVQDVSMPVLKDSIMDALKVLIGTESLQWFFFFLFVCISLVLLHHHLFIGYLSSFIFCGFRCEKSPHFGSLQARKGIECCTRSKFNMCLIPIFKKYKDTLSSFLTTYNNTPTNSPLN